MDDISFDSAQRLTCDVLSRVLKRLLGVQSGEHLGAPKSWQYSANFKPFGNSVGSIGNCDQENFVGSGALDGMGIGADSPGQRTSTSVAGILSYLAAQ